MSLDIDVIIRGGTVITMDPERRVLRADVLVRGDRIVAIEPRGRIGTAARVVDADGCVVVPGFVQAHVHLCQALFRGMADDLPLMDWLRRRIWPLEAAHDEASLRASARLGLAEMMRAGTTTILDIGTVHHEDVVFEAMAESGMRGFSGKAMMDRGQGVPKGLRETTRESLRESERLAAKWHGAESGRLGYAFGPRFILSCSEGLLRETATLARDKGARIHSHASEHKGERDEVRKILGKDDVDVLAGWGIAGPDVILAHGVQLGRAQMKRMAERGTRIAHCPSANLKLASGIADVVAMREAGLVVGIGADGAPCNNRMDPFTELRQAALLAKVRREDAAALAPIDALAMLTIDGAKALGIDGQVGSIEIGKKADVAVVRLDGLHCEPLPTGEPYEDGAAGGDPVARLVYSATASDVTDVLIDGRAVVRGGALRTLEEGAVREEARREALRLRKRAEIR
ncbi:5'-deoxyadenosine deaminase [Sandaracinus amylolyticus]|uniref:5'-deoxyadenosine deaminase n=1 Tax=Sandaracinus amylolyticus TaxID=927083 RepID=UPI001F26E32B|nr:5'-deoxyadenosine deaminase [Sandaracinus amylolyticus]UJR81653.1 S-adenosylhomocysteine deaminase [Sandaracinus amylolyticus]